MNINAKITDVRKLKIVQVPFQLRRNGRVALSFGEARIFANRARSQGDLDLEQLVTHNVPVSSVFEAEDGRPVVLDGDYDALVFVPARTAINSNDYAEEAFLEHVGKLFERLALAAATTGESATVVCSTPGTITNPDKEEQDRRWATLQAQADLYSIELVNRFAAADLRQEDRRVEVDVSGDIEVEFNDRTLLVVGSRKLEANSVARIEALHRSAATMLEAFAPEHVVTPLAVGFNLALAEMAVERGVPVTLVSMNATDAWAPATLDRLNAVLESGMATVTGKAEYEVGRIQATVKHLSDLAEKAGSRKAVVDEPTGSEAQHVTNAVSFWHVVKAFLQETSQEAAAARQQTNRPAPQVSAEAFDLDEAFA